MSIPRWITSTDPPDAFPDIELALNEPDGLLAAGGDLSSERLLAAYCRGIFPWYDEGQPILWWSPDPRCVLRPDGLRLSRRLRQYARRSTLTLRFNHAFDDVIVACAGERASAQGTWITQEMLTAYVRLHGEGWAHSIEIWDETSLVGGLYGLCIGRTFFGESMFSTMDNASKFAMLGLSSHMLDHGLEIIDCQVVSRHLMSMGAMTMPRDRFRQELDRLCHPVIPHQAWPTADTPVSEALQHWCGRALQ